MKATYKTGQIIQANIFGTIIHGTIIGIGTHKGRLVYDLSCDRFVYEGQIIGTLEPECN